MPDAVRVADPRHRHHPYSLEANDCGVGFDVVPYQTVEGKKVARPSFRMHAVIVGVYVLLLYYIYELQACCHFQQADSSCSTEVSEPLGHEQHFRFKCLQIG